MPNASEPDDPARDVWQREVAFAATMAERDAASFATFLSDDAIFLTGDEPLRGKAAVVAGWARYFEGPEAPFRWGPDRVEVTASGDLAFSSGPVESDEGESLGRFNTIWRLEEGVWRVVFDKGE